MAVRKTITISITPEQDDFVRDRLRSGRFASVSEVIRAAIRLLQSDEADKPHTMAFQADERADHA